MDKKENTKFDNVLKKGYAHLIETRPSMPMKEFIHHLWSNLPAGLKNKNEDLKNFCSVYEEVVKADDEE